MSALNTAITTEIKDDEARRRQADLDLMNEIRSESARLEKLVDRVRLHVEFQQFGLMPADERQRVCHADPLRWLSIARTDLQTGLMALTRAVAQPTEF